MEGLVKDLRDFIKLLRDKGELATIDTPVDPLLEMTEIADRTVKTGGPALLFTRPKGYDVPVLMNQFGTERRMCLALRAESYDEVAARVEKLTTLEAPGSTWDKLKALARLKELAALQPRVVKRGVCQEVVLTGDEIDLEMIPALQCWPLDAGRYITLPLVFTRHPVTGRRNVGMYRLQVFDKRTTGVHWHIHKDGAEHYREARDGAGAPSGGGAAEEGRGPSRGRMEVAVAIGADPALTYSATAPLPGAVDEMLFAGFLRGEAVDLVQCRTVDLQVPDHAEFVLEGYVDLDDTREEGPFGDHTGYYSLAEQYPVLHLTAITHRRDPVYSTTIVGQAPMEDAQLGKATERLFLPLIRLTLPELVDMDLPREGGFHNCAIVSVDKRYPLQARKVMHSLWGAGQMQFCKCIVVVDAGVDVHDYAQVAWRVFNNVDWKRDVLVVEGPLDVLDHSAPQPLWGAKIGIDATTKGPAEGHQRLWPPDVEMSPEVKARVDELWPSLGLGLGDNPVPRPRLQPGSSLGSSGSAGKVSGRSTSARPQGG
ncbi:MAG: menaquinone biosynthesis decarboxylase [Thermoleophilia bacterium]|nr:menaquinone biosynthesis decarboxylase [Thermoleophilia bacterium]